MTAPPDIALDRPLSWRQVAAIGAGATLTLGRGAEARIRAARTLVESIVALGVRAYGVNTGVGALCDVVVDKGRQAALSRNILMSHAVGVGATLESVYVRSILAAAINNFAHGYSGVRPVVVERLLLLLDRECVPDVPASGSVGYLTHMAHIALLLIGSGHARLNGELMNGAEALRALHLEPLVLEAKEGLSLVNGTPCATGLAASALQRVACLFDWADIAAAMSFENLHGQAAAFEETGLNLRVSTGVRQVGERLRELLAGSAILERSAGLRTQDALSLRAVPQVHGAARDLFAHVARVVDDELASVTDNPVVIGTPSEPRAVSGANAVGAALGLAVDSLSVAVAEVAAMAERRLDRLVNPLVSNLPAFLAVDGDLGVDGGAASGFMIAQCTAVSLAAENRRLAIPSSLDAGVTAGLQEDHLCHATPGALKLLKIIDNAEIIVAIEILAALQAYELQADSAKRATRTDAVYRELRKAMPPYRDDRPLSGDIEQARKVVGKPPAQPLAHALSQVAAPTQTPAPTRPMPGYTPGSTPPRVGR